MLLPPRLILVHWKNLFNLFQQLPLAPLPRPTSMATIASARLTLEKLGIKPLATQEFRLADGSMIARKKGGALFKHKERIGVADVIFGEEGDSVLLGAFTLEALGLSLDPLRRELKPLPMILAIHY